MNLSSSVPTRLATARRYLYAKNSALAVDCLDEAAEMCARGHDVQRAILNIRRTVDGSQPVDMPGAIMAIDALVRRMCGPEPVVSLDGLKWADVLALSLALTAGIERAQAALRVDLATVKEPDEYRRSWQDTLHASRQLADRVQALANQIDSKDRDQVAGASLVDLPPAS